MATALSSDALEVAGRGFAACRIAAMPVAISE